MIGLAWLALLWQVEGSPGAPTDSTASPGSEYFVPSGPLARAHLEPYGGAKLWVERVENRPNTTRALERARATVRAGLTWRPTSPLEARAGVRVSLGSDRNAESRAAFDNETPDTVEVDELSIGIHGARGEALLGKFRSPLALTELLWDPELRPAGMVLTVSPRRLAAPMLHVSGAWLKRSDLFGNVLNSDAWLGIGQIMYRQDLGSGARAEAVASYVRVGNDNVLPVQGFARQNATVSGIDPPFPGFPRLYANQFRVVDLQIAASFRWGQVPVAARVEGARNTARGVAHEANAVRTRVAFGGVEFPAGVEAGWVYQRIEREAVCGAFNSDDWWFHSRSRGNLAWMAVGVGRPVGFRVAAFVERRDDLTKDVRRFRAELLARLPTP